MHLYMQKLKNRKIPISFQFFCNIPNVICSHLPFVSIYYNVTLFIFEYVHKIIPDPPLVISPPLCIETYAPQFIGHNKLFLVSVSIVITFCFSGAVLLYASVVRVDETVKPLYFLTMPSIGTWVSKGTNII